MTTPRASLALLLLLPLLAAAARGETRTIDPGRSTMTVHVFKSGVLSAFGDNHEIRAPIVSGKAGDEGGTPRVELTVDARKMTVLDPELSPKKRAEVQERMLGPEVLDVANHPEIRFRSTKVEPLGQGRWRVEGTLELRGRSAPLRFEVTGSEGLFRGTAALKQTAFGITPITVAGGTVRVKDEVKVEFAIATTPAATGSAGGGSPSR